MSTGTTRTPNISPATQPSAAPAVVTLPFDEVGGLIIVKAVVDGQEGDFLLDTGSPMLVLRADRVAKNPVTLSLGTDTLHNVPAFIVPYELLIKRLEQQVKRPMLGILGIPAIAPFETIIDYTNHKVQFVRLDSSGHRVIPGSAAMRKDSIQLRLSFENNAGPYLFIKTEIAGLPISMTLDTGSPTNWLMDSSFKAIRAHCVEPSDPTALEQEEAKEASATLWACSPMTVGHISYDAARFTVASIHGYILGYPFLHAHGKVGLNIRTKQLFFY